MGPDLVAGLAQYRRRRNRSEKVEPGQIWLVGSDGKGLLRLTSEGENDVVGWTRLAPVLPPASPIPPIQRVIAPDTVATSTPVMSLRGRRDACRLRSREGDD